MADVVTHDGTSLVKVNAMLDAWRADQGKVNAITYTIIDAWRAGIGLPGFNGTKVYLPVGVGTCRDANGQWPAWAWGGTTRLSCAAACDAEPFCSGFSHTASGGKWQYFCQTSATQGTCTYEGNGGGPIVAGTGDESDQACWAVAQLPVPPEPPQPPTSPSPPATPPAPPAPPLAPYFDACYGQSCQGELPHLISACSTLIGNLGSTSSASCSTSCFASANCDMWLMSSSGACQLYTLSIGCTVQWHCGPSNWDGCVKQSSIANKSLAISRIEDVG